MAAQSRLKIKPVLSLRATNGCMPISLSRSTRNGKMRSSVSPSVMSSTMRFPGGM